MEKQRVMGVTAPSPRMTFAGLFMLAFALALPVGSLLWIAEWLWW